MGRDEKELIELWRLLKQLGDIYEEKNVQSVLSVTIQSSGACMLWADQMHGAEFSSFQEVIRQLKYEIECEGGVVKSPIVHTRKVC